MKKILYSLFAVAVLASCVKSEAVYTEDNSEIKIKPATALATKANHLAAIDGTEYPVEENFDVYAYWANLPAGNSFTNADADVTTYLGEGGAVEFTNKGVYWGGTTTYYWPKNGSLRFAAYSPSNVNMTHDLDTDTYTVENYEHPTTTATTWDLLVAPTSPSYTAMTAAENVSVVFEHALSWITVKVVAKDADAAKAFDIKKVTINDVNSVADLNAAMADGIQVEEWSNHNTPVGYVVYEGSQAVTETATVIETTPDGTVIIPQATTSITIDYTQNALEGTPALDNQSVTVDLVLDAEDSPWEPGKHYVYTLVFGLDEILINPDVVEWDEVIVNEIEVGKTNIYSAEQLAEALTADAENIEVVLVNDIDLPISSLGQITPGSGEYKLGSERTKNITIDLNGKTLNVTTTYWSNLGAKNADALITIKNGTMTSSQPTGTWNSYDLCFSNCNYVIEDVVFEKAIALCNVNRAATLKNVTINETHDYYAMWISAEGQNVTIDGLTINSAGRGIKIDEQYVDVPAHVTLNVANATFKTAKKAAILVKSAAGATINLDNVNIEGVAADKVFTVWVDADAAAYADKVVVNGGYCKVEGVDVVIVETAEALTNLAEMINNGTDFFEGKTITLYADIDLKDVEWTPIGSATAEHGFMGNFDGNGYVIKNLNMPNVTPDSDGYSYAGFFGVTEGTAGKENYIKNLVIENVTIETTGAIAAAAIAYPYYTTLENITVKGDVNIKGGDYTSGVLAYTRRCVNAKNIEIVANEGSSIEGRNTVGGVISDIQTNGGLTANYSNFKASGLAISGDQCVGGISGIISGQTLYGATVENVSLSCGDHRVGIVAGAKGTIAAVENVTYNNVTGATDIIGPAY